MAVEKFKCPKCKIVAIINRERKSKEIVHILDPDKGQALFPTHPDCELVKPVGKMNFGNLVKV